VHPRLRTALLFVGSLALGGGLLWLALRGVDFSSVGEALETADWAWALPLVLVTLLSHAIRAWRWTLLLGALPEAPPDAPRRLFGLAFGSTLIGYLVNAVIPRGGEVARAGNLASRSSITFAGAMGTVVVERVVDVIMLAVALLSVGVLYRAELVALVPLVAQRFDGLLGGRDPLPVVLALGGFAVAAAALAFTAWRWRRRIARQTAPAETAPKPGRLVSMLGQFRDGLASVARLKQRGAFIASTLGIWGCYLLMSDLPLRMLGLSARYNLSMADAWAVMNVGAIGMALPAPGGTGSYHYAIIQALGLLFNVPETPAATYALLTHAAQLALFAVGGLIAFLVQGAPQKQTGTAPENPSGGR
jgi:glycosyltransferase 2 family protein